MKKGFTLIELLVTITILGVLGAIGTASFQGLQSKARDSKRIQDLKAFATALEIYAQDNNGLYIANSIGQPEGCTPQNSNKFYTDIKTYMANQDMPFDPSTNEQYCYYSESSRTSFRLFAKLENCSNPEVIPGPCEPNTYNFTVPSSDLVAQAPGGGGPGPTSTPTNTPPAGTPTPTTSPSCPTSGLVAYWKMDEGAGATTVSDSAGSNNGTATGATSNVAGELGTAWSFDGVDDVIRVVESASTDLGVIGGSYSISSWIKTTTDFISAIPYLVTKNDGLGSPNVRPFLLYLNLSEEACFDISDDTSSPTACGATSLRDGNWHHLVGVRDAGADLIRIYVDGIQNSSVPDTTTISVANNDDISIGNGYLSYNSRDFNGSIDEVGIWNRDLSSAEIGQIYNGGLGRTCP